MNMIDGKRSIKDTLEAYLAKNQYGSPRIPPERQRPVYLEGAPGIGKTAIMKQIAQELGVPLVSYPMTHHTRQSALGLPLITNEVFDGNTVPVSKYTMSEIIAAVYKAMEDSGVSEGILFLDEFNCVSETLAPAMLQFLQSKEFGGHRLPEGWIIVIAGNPVEYNDSARELDMVTLDRLCHIKVEADYDIWRDYAVSQSIFPAILSYLDIYPDDFSYLETTVDGKEFVTPRSWIDLSEMMRYYDSTGKTINLSLIEQYIQAPAIARRFMQFYELWLKYRSDYQIPEIMDGKESPSILSRARAARFDERVALINFMSEGVSNALAPVIDQRTTLAGVEVLLKDVRRHTVEHDISWKEALEKIVANRCKTLDKKRNTGAISKAEESACLKQLDCLQELMENVHEEDDAVVGYNAAKQALDVRRKSLKSEAATAQKRLENVLGFADRAFGESHEMVLLIASMTASPVIFPFITTYGCESYSRLSKALNFRDRDLRVLKALEDIEKVGA